MFARIASRQGVFPTHVGMNRNSLSAPKRRGARSSARRVPWGETRQPHACMHILMRATEPNAQRSMATRCQWVAGHHRDARGRTGHRRDRHWRYRLAGRDHKRGWHLAPDTSPSTASRRVVSRGDAPQNQRHGCRMVVACILNPPELGVHVFRNSADWSLATHPMNDSTDTAHRPSRQS